MEYFILFGSYWLIPIITTKFILPKNELLVMSPFKSIILPYIVIAILIYIITLILNMIRAVRTCPKEADQSQPFGFFSGTKLSLFATIGAIIMYIVINLFPVLNMPFIAISILPYASEIGLGFYAAVGAFLGYWFGRPFIGLC